MLLIGTLFACSNKQKNENAFVLNGTLEGVDRCHVAYLVDIYEPQEDGCLGYHVIDSTTITNNQFTFKGELKAAKNVGLILDYPSKRAYDGKFIAGNFFIDKGEMALTISQNADMPDDLVLKLTGSKANEEYMAYKKSMEPMSKKADSLYGCYMNTVVDPQTGEIVNKEEGIRLYSELYELNKQKKEQAMNYIIAHPESPISIDIFRIEVLNTMECIDMSSEQITKALDAIGSKWAGTDEMKSFDEQMEVINRLTMGTPITNVKVLNLEGKEVDLKDYVEPGKINLIEFWASWCSPCRGEIPHLHKVLKEYGADKFNIVSVSMDENVADWTKAIADEKMTWTQLRLADNYKDPAAKTYGITAIPFGILVDKEGKIIATNARGSRLDYLMTLAK